MFDANGQPQFVACKEVEATIREWMHGGGNLFPEHVMGNDHLFEVWAEYVEQHENDLAFLR